MAEPTSRNNPKIKLARSLQQRKFRRETGLFLVEGLRHVGELLASGQPVEYLCYAPDILISPFARETLEQAKMRGLPILTLTPETLASLGERDGADGIIAVAKQNPRPLSDLDPQTCPLGVALVSPQDPGNLGTILRTMDAAGARGLLLLDGGADAWHPTAVRASMGALFWQPIVQTGFAEFSDWARAQGYHVYGTSAHGTADFRETSYLRPAILLLGSEREGLTPEQAAACEKLVRIPMGGRGTSLNLAVAAGVMLYEMSGENR